MNTTEDFLDLICGMANGEFPDTVIKQAARCLLDYLGTTLAGEKKNDSRIQAVVEGNPGQCSVIGSRKKAALPIAVSVNAMNAHTLELDDGHRKGMLHLAAPIFSGLVSVAEQEHCTMRDVYKGAVIGYETAVRLACTIQPGHKKRGFHATGTCGTIGCALGTAAMLHYKKDEMRNVLSAAATSSAGLLEVITGRSEQKPYNIVNAADAGVRAALFGKLLMAPEDILGGERGFFAVFAQNNKTDGLLEESKSYAIEEIYMKPYAACRHCHSPIEAALTLREKYNIEAADIQNITVDTYDLAVYGHDHTHIEGCNSAKMSIPYSVSAAFITGSAGQETFSEKKIQDPRIQRLMQRITVRADEGLSALVPQKRAAAVKLEMADGTTYSCKIEYPKGEPENPIRDEELLEKTAGLLEYAGRERELAGMLADFLFSSKDKEIKELLELVQ